MDAVQRLWQDDYRREVEEVLAREIGSAEGIPVYVMAHLAEQWQSARVTLDLIDEDSSDALSLETEHGVRLVLRHG